MPPNHGLIESDATAVERSIATSDGTSIAEAIVTAVCELRDATQEDLDFVLYDRIDPDALEGLLASADGRAVTVEFMLADCQVTVRADRTLTVRKLLHDVSPSNAEGEIARSE